MEKVKREEIKPKPGEYGWGDDWGQSYFLAKCGNCQWWSLCYVAGIEVGPDECYSQAATFSSLCDFVITDKEVPLDHLFDYVRKHFEALEVVHPRRFEELVVSVFREHGFECELTSYSKDGGIDLILFRKNKSPTAVQVKRYRKDRRIGIDELHQFLGAMIVEGYKRGVFVTTSSFTRGARQLPKNRNLNELCIELELFDSDRLIDYISAIPPKPVREPWDVAWDLRHALPNAFSLAGCGEWGFLKAPFVPMSPLQMDRWLADYKSGLGQSPGLKIPTEEELLAGLSRKLESIKPGTILHLYDKLLRHPTPAYPVTFERLNGASFDCRTLTERPELVSLDLDSFDDIQVRDEYPPGSDCRDVGLRWGA